MSEYYQCEGCGRINDVDELKVVEVGVDGGHPSQYFTVREWACPICGSTEMEDCMEDES